MRAWPGHDGKGGQYVPTCLRLALAALVWDNIPLGTVISCPVLESVLTTDHWTDRQLSVSKTPIVQAFTVMAFTGNNVGPGGDLASRVLKVDLVVDRVDPEN